MITCTLGETKYSIDFVSGRALREMGPVRWFCILFGNQFSPDDVFDHYPVDRLIHDITFAMMAVQAQATSVLSEFPIPAAQETKAS